MHNLCNIGRKYLSSGTSNYSKEIISEFRKSEMGGGGQKAQTSHYKTVSSGDSKYGVTTVNDTESHIWKLL